MSRILLIIWVVMFWPGAQARDHGQYGNQTPEMKDWFKGLKSGKGPCCSDADGSVVKDSDWVVDRDGHYRVYINGEWKDVPDDAVLHQPNMYGRTMVWMGMWINGIETVRCFIPGSMT